MSGIKYKVKNNLRVWFPFLYREIYKLSFIKVKFDSSIYKTKEDYIRYQKIPLFTSRGFSEFTLDNVKFKILLDPSNGAVDQEIFCFGNFEKNILKIIGKNLKNDEVFLDIGANIGQHSLYASSFANKVIAFEPIRKLALQIEESVMENEIYNIKVINSALGENDQDGVPIYTAGHNIGASSIGAIKGHHMLSKINIRKLDSIFPYLEVANIGLIKIDVEGYEYEVLHGAKGVIHDFRPKVILEFSPHIYKMTDNDHSSDIFNFFINSNYKVYDLGDGSKMEEVKNVNQIINCGQTNLFCIPI